MPPRKRRSFTAEHKVEAAHRVIDSGRTIAAAEVRGEEPLNAAERAELLWFRRRSLPRVACRVRMDRVLGILQRKCPLARYGAGSGMPRIAR